MKHYNFEHTQDKLPPDTGIGWLLNNKILDKAVEGTTQNLLDFYSFKYRRIPQVSSYDFVELCNKGLREEARLWLFQNKKYPSYQTLKKQRHPLRAASVVHQ